MQHKSIPLVLALGALVTSGALASAPLAQASPVCRVENTRNLAKYTTLQAAVEAETTRPGDRLKLQNTCEGDTTVSKNLTIVGAGPLPTLNGDNEEGSEGSVVTVNGGITLTITDLTITGGYSHEDGARSPTTVRSGCRTRPSPPTQRQTTAAVSIPG
jgi:hypothetical protein